MPKDAAQDPVRQAVDAMSEAEIAAVLDQIAALSEPGPPEEGAFTAVAGVSLPRSLVPLLDVGPPEVLAEIAELCASTVEDAPALTEGDVARIARPYRVLLDLAGEDGLELTQAGWLRPATVVELAAILPVHWIGKTNREHKVPSIAYLRETTVDLGLLRKHKGRLLRTRKAERLRTDHDIVAAVAGGLLEDRATYLAAARGLFALLTAQSGRCELHHSRRVAEILTRCGLRVGSTGVREWDAMEMVRPTWAALASDPMNLSRMTQPRDERHHIRSVALAVAALWPERFIGQA